jgi:signal transduction histidine kinase
MRTRDRLTRFLGSWRSDAVLAAGLSGIQVAWAAEQGTLHGLNNLIEIGIIASSVARRRSPKLAALAASGFMLLTLLGKGSHLPYEPYAVAILLLAYSLGTADDVGWCALVMVIMQVCLQALDGITVFNPSVPLAVLGPWALGLAVRSRRKVAEQLAVRGAELAAERELYAAEAIRYERATIARELHDIVAHCLTVMVIQASAARRLSGQDPGLAADAFAAITESVLQAESEIGRLVELLGHEPAQPLADGISLVDELVARAAAAGMTVRSRLIGSPGGLSPQAAEATYRVVQESLTNAFKHAPGAPVDVVMTQTDRELHVRITNGAPAAPPSGLERAGAGRGLAGMRERAHACGGEVTAGPAEGGGWQVHARFPNRRPHLRA